MTVGEHRMSQECLPLSLRIEMGAGGAVAVGGGRWRGFGGWLVCEGGALVAGGRPPLILFSQYFVYFYFYSIINWIFFSLCALKTCEK